MILDEIAESAKKRVAEQKKKIPFETIRKAAEEKAAAERESGKNGFEFPLEKALCGKDISFICEVKKASPSKGVIAEDFPYLEIAREYERAISR